MTNELTFALLVPCYNATSYIQKFVNNISLLKGQFDEIIFYDDGSTDDTAVQLAKNGFTVIGSAINNGPGFARNRLAEKSKCDFIHFHDIDDEFHPDFLLLIKGKLQISSADVVFGFADWLDADTRFPIIKWRYDQRQLLKSSLSYLIANPLGVINAIYKKTTFTSIGGFDQKMKCWEDSDLHVRLAAANATFAVINSVIAYSIRHNNGISKDQASCWECRLSFLKKYLDNYFFIVQSDVFKLELKKVQNMLINLGKYDRLIDIILLNNRYNLGLDVSKTWLIIWSDNIFPSAVTRTMMKFGLYILRLKNGY